MRRRWARSSSSRPARRTPSATRAAIRRGGLDGRLASYQTLIDISRMLLGSATLAELFDRMASELKRLVPFDGVTVYRLDPVAEVLMPMHAVDDYADEIMAAPIGISQGV